MPQTEYKTITIKLKTHLRFLNGIIGACKKKLKASVSRHFESLFDLVYGVS